MLRSFGRFVFPELRTLIQLTMPDVIMPEILWDAILSREPKRIILAFKDLNEEERISLIQHLERMTGEAGWHPEQIRSAQIALSAIRSMATD